MLPSPTRFYRVGLFCNGLALALMALSAFYFAPGSHSNVTLACYLLAAGAVSLTLGQVLRQCGTVVEMPGRAAASDSLRVHGLGLIVGLLLLLVVAEISGQLLGIPALTEVSMHVQFALLVGGLLLVGWSLAGAPNLFKTMRAAASELSLNNTTLLLVGILLLALVLRLWRLGLLVGIPIDELFTIEGVVNLWHDWGDQTRPLLTPVLDLYLPFPYIYSYGQFWSVELFGNDLFGLRFPSAVFGTLAVLVIYHLVRTIAGGRAALIAAFLLAVFPPHLQFSRLSLLHMGDSLFGALTVWLLVRGMGGNRQSDWALAGITLGLTHYFYEGGRLFYFVLVGGWLLYTALVQWGALRRRWRGVLVLLVAFTATILPLYYTYIGLGRPFVQRLEVSGVGGGFLSTLFADGFETESLVSLLVKFTRPLLNYVHDPEFRVHLYYYGGDTPLILIYVVPFFLLGMVYLLWQWRKPASLVFLWIIGAAMANGFMQTDGGSARYVIVLPALVVPVALALNQLPCRVMLPDWSAAKRMAQVAVMIAVLVLGGLQVDYYFRQHVPRFLEQTHEYYIISPVDSDVFVRSNDLPPVTQIYIINDPPQDRFHPVVYYDVFAHRPPLGLTYRYHDPGYLTDDILAKFPRDRNYAFFIEPDDDATLELLQAHFETEEPQFSRYDIAGDSALMMIYVPVCGDNCGG